MTAITRLGSNLTLTLLMLRGSGLQKCWRGFESGYQEYVETACFC